MHKLGYAHSAEAWSDGKLVGGLYGVSLGRTFFGESMFTEESNASKAAFIILIEKLSLYDFKIIDCQVHTPHLESLGAEFISRTDFISQITESFTKNTIKGNWGELIV